MTLPVHKENSINHTESGSFPEKARKSAGKVGRGSDLGTHDPEKNCGKYEYEIPNHITKY